jgi:hypothetical protein
VVFLNTKALFFLAFLLASLFLPEWVFAQDKPWDSLRLVTELAHAFSEPIKWLNLILALVLLAVSLFAYKKNRSQRFLFVSLAFLFFAIKWGLVVLDIYVSPGSFLGDASQNVFEFFIFLFLVLALFKR